jgi:hypothetical protein
VSEGLKIVALSARVRYGDAPEVPLHAAGHFGCGLPFNVFREKGCYVASMFVTLAIGRFASLMQLIDGFSVRFSGRSRLFCTTNLQIGLPSPPVFSVRTRRSVGVAHSSTMSASTNGRILKKEEKTLCRDPGDQEKSAGCDSQHQQRAKVRIVRQSA